MSETASSTLTDPCFQELKEAVCDAILERTRRITSGEGDHGKVILGDKPSRVLSSGFVLPRLNSDGDDESSDIRIASHGLDLRLRRDGHGSVRVRVSFSVYVRALPTAHELFARNGRLIPPADFSKPAKQYLRNQIRDQLKARFHGGTPAERAAARREVTREVRAKMGVVQPNDGSCEPDVEPDDEDVVVSRGQDIRTRLRIPSHVSRTYDVPQKWVRVEVVTPDLELALPWVPDVWKAAMDKYRQQLVAAARDACNTWISSSEGQLWAWRPVQVPSEAFWEPAAWDAFVVQARTTPPDASRLVPPLDVQILVDPLPDAIDSSVTSVRIAFDNLREFDDERECGAFGVALSIELPATTLVPMRLERVRRSYHLAGFLSMPAVGVNGGVEDRGIHDGIHTLRTTWMPRYVLPRLRATTIAAVPTDYASLSAEAQNVGALSELPRAMRLWIADIERDTPLFWPDEPATPIDDATQRTRFLDDLDAWRSEADRIAQGVDVLVRSCTAWQADRGCVAAIPYRAWLLVNRAFANANPRRAGSDPPGWRLFQLAFVLAHVPTLASRIPGFERDFDAAFDEEAASLLCMSTGGGKTEAFFGTIVYALFLDRLRGKHRGVTAMMHYPLRLLTIQQAQRLARLLAKAELVRREARVEGAAFEVGFWVGGSNTPNSTETKAGQVRPELRCIPTWRACSIAVEERLTNPETGNNAYVAARDAWNKLPECPFCGASTGLRLFPERHNRLGIVCAADACPWNAAHQQATAPEPLPFLLADTDIYRCAPAILLGTIDKLALLGQSPHTIHRIAGMFGVARLLEGSNNGLLHSPNRDVDELPEGYRRLAPSWAGGYELFHDPFPSLIVQDELHLLDESLGTFGGVFETSLFAWFGELAAILGSRVSRVPGAPEKPRLPHVIGATATAADAEKHVSALYQKHVVQFPHPGPSLHGSFYVHLADFMLGSDAHAARTVPTAARDVHPRDKEAAAPWARVYASLMTNGRLHTMTTLSVLAAHATTVTRWLRDLASQDSHRRNRAATEIRNHVSTSQWADRRRVAVDRVIAENRYDRLATLVDLHRIELTYVTNKKGGDQILAAIEAEVAEAHEAMGSEYILPEFKMELISGGIDVKGIQSVIRTAETKFDPMREDVAGALRGIVATSAISHGVDVETFNAMAFAGMPSDIAEYIQASSRVGRTHVGFSLLVPTPQARRDRFIVGVHEVFHRLLERMISPPAIERWADRALERTIPSLVQMWLAGIYYQRAFIAAPDGNKSSARFPATVEVVDRLFGDRDGPACLDDCVAFVQAAVGIGAPIGGPGRSADYYRNLVLRRVREIRAEIGSRNFTGDLHEFWDNLQNPLRRNKPMTSLRDVDESGKILGSGVTLKSKPMTRERLVAAMALLRNRGVSRQRQSAHSETDTED